MKKIRLYTIVASTSIAAALLLNGGCGKGGETASQAPPEATSSGSLPSAEKNSFKEVAAHLDAGGNFYLYLSTEKWLDGLSGKISDWRGAGPGPAGPRREDPTKRDTGV